MDLDFEFEFDLCHEATANEKGSSKEDQGKKVVLMPGYKTEYICPYRHL